MQEARAANVRLVPAQQDSKAEAAGLQEQLRNAEERKEAAWQAAQAEQEALRAKLAAAEGGDVLTALRAQVAALEEDLEKKDASWVELQGRWVGVVVVGGGG